MRVIYLFQVLVSTVALLPDKKGLGNNTKLVVVLSARSDFIVFYFKQVVTKTL